MFFIIFRIIVNIALIFAAYNLINLTSKSRNDWERANSLNFSAYHHNTSKHEMIYNISAVINKNEALNHTLDSLRVKMTYNTI